MSRLWLTNMWKRAVFCLIGRICDKGMIWEKGFREKTPQKERIWPNLKVHQLQHLLLAINYHFWTLSHFWAAQLFCSRRNVCNGAEAGSQIEWQLRFGLIRSIGQRQTGEAGKEKSIPPALPDMIEHIVCRGNPYKELGFGLLYLSVCSLLFVCSLHQYLLVGSRARAAC